MPFSRPQAAQYFEFPRWSAPASFASRDSSLFQSFYRATVLLVVLVAIVGRAEANMPDTKCIEEFEAGKDYFPNKVSAEDATGWNIEYHGHYKVVNNLLSSEQYVLTMCGASAPDAADFPETTKFFQIPLNSVAVDETVGATTLELLGLRTKVRYIDTTYLTSPCLTAMKLTQQLDDFPYDGEDRDLKAAKVDAVIGGLWASSNANTIAFASTADTTPLGRGEWIKFMAAFFNAEHIANAVYEESSTRFQCHSEAAQSISDVDGRPTVAWIDHQSWTETPFVIQAVAYKQALSRMAGGRPLYEAEEHLRFATAAELVEALGDVDVVIDESYNLAGMEDVKALFGISNNLAARWWRNDRLVKYTTDGVAASDWFESAMPEPDVVLEDLIAILHPNLQEHDMHWFRKPSASRVEVTKKCKDIEEQITLKHDGCPYSTNPASCKGNCHREAPDGCWCDTLCQIKGDCCADISDHCVMSLNTCKGHCGKRGLGSPDCWCDDKCTANHDCCHDFAAECPVSCAGACGGKAGSKDLSCYCDDTCQDMGDCCHDYKSVCSGR